MTCSHSWPWGGEKPHFRKTRAPSTHCSTIYTSNHPKWDQSWVFFGRIDAEAETPVLWPPHAKSWLIGKDSDAGRDWGQEEKGTTEDEMAGWHHWVYGCESEWTPGVGDGQGGLVCCDSWGCKESDTTERLNWTELNHNYLIHSSADRHLVCSHVLAIANSAAINIGIHVSLSILASSGCILSSGITGSHGRSIPSYLRNHWK